MQRFDEDQKKYGLCVTFGDKTFEAVVSGNDEDINVMFVGLNFLGGGYSTSETAHQTQLKLSSLWSLGQPIMTANIDGKEVIVQVQIFIVVNIQHACFYLPV